MAIFRVPWLIIVTNFVIWSAFFAEIGVCVTEFRAASYIITQQALDDAPVRYAQFIQEAINQMEASQWPYISDSGGGCHVEYHIDGPSAVKTITLEPNSVKATFVENGVNVVGTVDVSVRVPAFLRPCTKILFWCACKTVCDGWVTLNTQVITSTNFVFGVDANGGIIVSSQPTVTVPNPALPGGCNVPGWLNWFVNVQAIIQEAFQAATNAAAQALTQQIGLPQVFSPYEGVFVYYRMNSATFTPNTHAIMQANATLVAEAVTSSGYVNQTFDADLDDANMGPPTDWTTSNSSLYLLNGLRVSSTMLTGLMWAADVTNAFDYTYNFTVLDAHLGFHIDWDPPLVGIPDQDNLYLQVAAGTIYGNCLNPNQTCNIGGNNCEAVLVDITFSNLQGNGSVNYTYENGSPGFIICITSFDVDAANVTTHAPPIPLPQNVMEAIARRLLLNSIPFINDYLASHAFLLPSKYAPYIPNPELRLYHQPGCCQDLHGYIDMTSWCQCGASDSPWGQCDFVCTRPRDVEVEEVVDHVELQRKSTQGIVVSFFTSAVGPNGDCSMNEGGDIVQTAFLAPTDAQNPCLPVPEDNFNGTSFYSLTYHNNKPSISLFCNQLCQQCIFYRKSLEFYKCYRKEHQSFTFQPVGTTTCLGSSYQPGRVIWMLYNGTDNCNPNAQLLGTNMGGIDSCISNDNATFSSTICFQNNTCNLHWFCEDSSCDTNCQFQVDNLGRNECINMTAGYPVSGRLLFLANSDLCPTKKSQAWKWILSISVVGGVGIIMAIIGLAHFFRKRKAKCPSIPNLTKDVSRRIAAVFHAFGRFAGTIWSLCKRFIRWLGEKLTQLWAFINLPGKYNTLCSKLEAARSHFEIPNLSYAPLDIWYTLPPATLSLVYVIVWTIDDPFTLFEESKFENMGFPAEEVQYTGMSHIFRPWSSIGLIVTIASCAWLWILFVARLFFEPRAEKWKAVVCFTLTLFTLLQPALFLAPPFFYKFASSIEIVESTDNFITQSKDLRQDLDTLFGFAFCGIALTYLSHIYMITLLAITYASSIGAVLFALWVSREEISSAIFAYISIQQAILTLTFPITTALPVIILYQSFGVARNWIFIWAALWTLFGVGYWNVRTTLLARSKEINKSRLIVHLCLFVPAFLAFSGYIFYIEATSTELSITFAVITFLYTAVLATIAQFAYLQRFNASLKKSNAILTVRDTPKSILQKNFDKKEPEQSLPHRYVGVFLNWLLEWKEHEDPVEYGLRGFLRRLCLCVGSFTFVYVVYRVAFVAIKYTPQQRLVNFLNAIGLQMTWPSASDGGTIFNDAFSLYTDAEWCQVGLLLTTSCLALVSLWIDTMHRNKFGQLWSARILLFSIVLLFIAIIVVALPNYLRATHINQMFPHCGPQFDKMVNLVSGDIVGIGYALLFTATIGPILITVPISLLRAANLTLRTQHVKLLGRKQLEVIRLLFIQISFSSPVVTVLPIMVAFQILGDTFVGVMIAVFYIGPCLVAQFSKVDQPMWVYWTWLFFYLGPLITIVIYEVIKYRFAHSLIQILQTPEFWCEAIAEIALGVVVLSDVLNSSLHLKARKSMYAALN